MSEHQAMYYYHLAMGIVGMIVCMVFVLTGDSDPVTVFIGGSLLGAMALGSSKPPVDKIAESVKGLPNADHVERQIKRWLANEDAEGEDFEAVIDRAIQNGQVSRDVMRYQYHAAMSRKEWNG